MSNVLSVHIITYVLSKLSVLRDRFVLVCDERFPIAPASGLQNAGDGGRSVPCAEVAADRILRGLNTLTSVPESLITCINHRCVLRNRLV